MIMTHIDMMVYYLHFFSTGFTLDNLSADGKLILEEITRFLNLEKLLPCYRHTVAVRYVVFYY